MGKFEKNRFFGFLFILVSISALAPQALAESPITTKRDYYSVEGKTKDELRESMRRNSRGRTGGEFFAYTDWNIRWNYKSSSAGGGCEVTSSDVSLEIVFHMPHREDANPLSPLKWEWDGFIKALQKHEDGHARIGTDCFHAVEEAIKKVGPCGSCGELDSRLHQAVDKTIAEFRRKEYEYDAKTDHGMNQGARW